MTDLTLKYIFDTVSKKGYEDLIKEQLGVKVILDNAVLDMEKDTIKVYFTVSTSKYRLSMQGNVSLEWSLDHIQWLLLERYMEKTYRHMKDWSFRCRCGNPDSVTVTTVVRGHVMTKTEEIDWDVLLKDYSEDTVKKTVIQKVVETASCFAKRG